MDHSFAHIEQQTLKTNYRLMIQMRGMAFYAQTVTVLACYWGLHLVLPLSAMFIIIALLAAYNLYCYAREKSSKALTENDLFFGFLVDVAGLTGLFYLSGGVDNPFITLYLIPIILASVLLSRVRVWGVLAASVLAYGALSLLVVRGPKPEIVATGSWFDPYTHGALLAFVMVAGALVFFVTRVVENLKSRDRALDALHRAKAESDSLAAIGLISAGAAHEISTPLATLAFTISDWHEYGLPKQKASQKSALVQMMAQINRCREAISDFLTATQQTRSEGVKKDTVFALVSRLKARFEATLGRDLVTELPPKDQSLIVDKTVEQALWSVLQNAHEAAHAMVTFKAHISEQTLEFIITDDGNGFVDDILQNISEAGFTTKGSAGRGVGLFLAKKSVSQLGGTIEFFNQEQGASVRISLPQGVWS